MNIQECAEALAGMSAAEYFFYVQAGASYRPDRQTREEGTIEQARKLAAAEEWAKSALSFEWGVDDSRGSREWTEDKPTWATWYCIALNSEDDNSPASLHGIDFGRHGEPWGDPYKRVVEAELALECAP